ncbi:MAG: deoxyribose-phosphate aldolase [Ilumatobacter sp.]
MSTGERSEQAGRPDVAATARRVIGLIDLTNLANGHEPDGVAALLDDASSHRTAAVCVWPEFVAGAVDRLAGSGVHVATVANFPGGNDDHDLVVDDVGRSLDAGADEIDVVMPYQPGGAGTDRPEELVAAVARLVHDRGARLKVILETGERPDRDSIVAAGRTAIANGADFLKTSTGKTPNGASLGAVDAMIDAIVGADRVVGLKPSGGISTVADATAYLDLVERRLGAEATDPRRFRIGASSLLADAVSLLDDPH